MICFLSALRHPAVAKDYGKIEAMLKDTLASALACPDPRIRVVVVGHVQPSFPMPDRADFVRVDFDPPMTRTGRIPSDIIRMDKGRKLAVAAAYAVRNYDPAYLAMLDSDDFVSKRLGAFILDAAPGNGWVIDAGYAYSPARGQLFGLKNFHRRCGTSIIYNRAHVEVPQFNTANPTASADGMDIEYVKDMYGSHIVCHDYLQKRGQGLRPVPFPGAIYLIETGQNSVGFKIEQLPHTGMQPVTPELADEFALPVSVVG